LLGKFGILLTGQESRHFSFVDMIRSRTGRAPGRIAPEPLEEGEVVMMDRGRSGPVQFRDGEAEREDPEKAVRSSRSRRPGAGNGQAGSLSNTLDVP
jgi:hypothetical protein